MIDDPLRKGKRMKKSHIIASLLLTAAMLLTGCSEKTNNTSPPADTSSTTISQPESTPETESTTQHPIIESTQSSTETVSSTENSTPESSVQNTSEEAEPIPVEFTDEDRELQKILSDLYDPTWEVISWFSSLGIPDYSHEWHQFLRLTIIGLPFDWEMEYDRIPDNFRHDGNMFDVPTSKAEMGKFISKYFSKEMTDTLLDRIPVCELVERSENSLIVKFKDDPEIYQKEGFQIWFVEVDGRLYVPFIQGVRGYIEVDTAKVTKKTDDTIAFIYLESPSYSKEEIINNASLYSECVESGTIKLEDGVWKMHSWDDMHFPLKY